MHIVIYTCILCTSRIGPIGTHRHIPPIQNVYDPGRDLIFSWTSLRYFAGDSRSQCSNVDERYQRCQLWYLGGTWNKLWCNGSWSSYSIIYIYYNIHIIYILYYIYSDIYVLACHVSKWDPFGSADHCPTQAHPGTLLFATPFTATAPNGTVIWIMSTIGAQIGMVLVSNVQNGISCPMLAAWRRGRELSHVSVALSGKVGPSLGKGWEVHLPHSLGWVFPFLLRVKIGLMPTYWPLPAHIHIVSMSRCCSWYSWLPAIPRRWFPWCTPRFWISLPRCLKQMQSSYRRPAWPVALLLGSISCQAVAVSGEGLGVVIQIVPW